MPLSTFIPGSSASMQWPTVFLGARITGSGEEDVAGEIAT